MSITRSTTTTTPQAGVKLPGRGRFRGLDPVLIAAALALTGFGIFAVYTSGVENGPYYATNQAAGLVAGVALAVPLALMDYRRLKGFAEWLFGAAIAMLLAVAFFGTTINGAKSWIELGPFQVQPSEFAKLLMIVVLAKYLSDNPPDSWGTFLKALGIMMLPTLLVFTQPDLGTALVFGAVFVAMVFVGGARLWHLGTLFGAGIAAFVVALKFNILHEYQIQRLTAFLQPELSTDLSYQVLQSKIAVGSGGLLGKGLEANTLANLGFLPEDHTDFIFSNLAERTGFVGSMIVLALFFILIWRILRIGTVARDKFGVLVAVGVSTMFVFQVFVNIGMALGMMPVTGLPLPLVSYGRSSLIMSVMSIGLLLSIAMRSKAGGARHSDL
ncbi:rod shape-determining protein RodA [Rubrobacter taiwanensis]|uniref:Peptidoglycan glycosyltransferase RodA n=1 Tax=Rubrobacter taiwanensis TaxID=185139 RepID=A0A4R1BJ37_9ACTN|nr:rod shape-determining protein RodA [Rubrobacter taiwanensis]TCJ17330.1 rod shape-determining protein RodA [Rubrobacter taiwanensis]